MDTYIDRLYHERSELRRLINNLEAFIISGKVAEIAVVQLSLLNRQHSAMKTYMSCLEERISWIERTVA